MGKIIACVNEKGGVAKTTTIKNLSIGLAMLGKKVLVIDFDPSQNFTKSLDMVAEDGIGTICDILDHTIEMEDVPEGLGIQHSEEGIDVIASSSKLITDETGLINATYRETVLRRYIETVKDMYDYIFIDCPAGIRIYTINALFAADQLIIPIQPHIMSVDAVQNLFAKIVQVRKLNGTGTKPEILGGLFTMVRGTTNNDKKIMEKLRDAYGPYMNFFETIIPQSSKLPETDVAKCSIFSLAPHSSAAIYHMDFIYEFLKIEGDELPELEKEERDING